MASVASAREATDRARLLVVVMDAIPYEVAAEVIAEAPQFERFHAPAALISSFPSSTNLAVTGILRPFGVPPAPGYEARFFDRQRNRIRGGVSLSHFRVDTAWREFFDYRRRSLMGRGFAKLRPIKGGIGELRRGLERFAESDAEVFFVYGSTSDAAAHLRRPEAAGDILRQLGVLLEELRRREDVGRFHVVLLSDHGMAGGEPLVNIRPDLRTRLDAAGWKLGKRLRDERDVVLAPFGMLSSFEIFGFPEGREELARLAFEVEGVDLCVHPRDDDEWWVGSARRGEAHVERRPSVDKTLWSYRPVRGDPLGYAPLVEELAARRLDRQTERARTLPDGHFPDSWWFEVSVDSRYPDALHRISGGFELVESPASVICSLEPGYMMAGRTTSFGATLTTGHLEWTHGALSAEASLAFFATDHPAWKPEPAVRFDQALEPVRDWLTVTAERVARSH